MFRVPTCLLQLHSSRGAMPNSRHHQGFANNVCTSLCSHAVVTRLLETVHTHVSFLACVTVLPACSQCFSQQPSCWGRDTPRSLAPAFGWVCSSRLVLHHTVPGARARHLAGVRTWHAGCCCGFCFCTPGGQSTAPCTGCEHMPVRIPGHENGHVGREAAPWACSDSFLSCVHTCF